MYITQEIVNMNLQENIRRILKEESLKQSLIDEVKNNGVQETAELVGGISNLIGILEIETPMDFLNIYNDLEIVESEEKPDYYLFRHNKNDNVIMYNKKTDFMLYNQDKFWPVFTIHFKMNHYDIDDMISNWLKNKFNITIPSTRITNVPQSQYTRLS